MCICFLSPLRGFYLSTKKEGIRMSEIHSKFSSPLRGFYLSTLPSAYLVNQRLYVWFAGQITNQTFFFETNNFLWLFSLFYGYRRKLILLRTLSFPFPYHKVPPDILYIYRHEEQVLILYLSYAYGFHTVFPVYF